MQNLTVADEFVERSVVTICETSMNVSVILEQKEVKLDLSFGVGCLVDDFVN